MNLFTADNSVRRPEALGTTFNCRVDLLDWSLVVRRGRVGILSLFSDGRVSRVLWVLSAILLVSSGRVKKERQVDVQR
jgi:hypothetical protein